jgi:hypothetical protein
VRLNGFEQNAVKASHGRCCRRRRADLGTALFGYRWYARPTTFTIAVGSLDGEAGRIVSAIATGDENALDVTTLNVAAHRLQSPIHDRRILLAAPPGGAAPAAL